MQSELCWKKTTDYLSYYGFDVVEVILSQPLGNKAWYDAHNF